MFTPKSLPTILLIVVTAWSLSACRSAPIIPPNPLPPIAEVQTQAITQVWQKTSMESDSATILPAVFGDSSIFARAKNRLMRINLDGAEVWQINLPDDINAGVGANADLVVVSTQDGVLRAFSADNGQLLWQQPMTSEVMGVPLITSGKVIVRTSEGLVIGFDAKTGNRTWLMARPIGALSVRSNLPMLVLDDAVVAGGPQGGLFAFNPNNGQLLWERVISRAEGISEVERLIDIVSAPAAEPQATSLRKTQVCASTFNGKTACVRGEDGRMLWQADIASASGLLMGSDKVWVVGRDDTLYALSLFDGKVIWKNELLKGRALGAPILMSQGLMLGDGLGYVLIFNPQDGRLISASPTPGAIANVSGLKINPRYLAPAPMAWGKGYLLQSRLGSLTYWQ